MLGWFEQFILGLVPGILASLLNALKVTPGSLPPALLATLQAIDETLDLVLGAADVPTPTPPTPPAA